MKVNRTYLAIIAVQRQFKSGQQILLTVDVFEREPGGRHASLTALPSALPLDREYPADVQLVVDVRIFRAQDAPEYYNPLDEVRLDRRRLGATGS